MSRRSKTNVVAQVDHYYFCNNDPLKIYIKNFTDVTLGLFQMRWTIRQEEEEDCPSSLELEQKVTRKRKRE